MSLKVNIKSLTLYCEEELAPWAAWRLSDYENVTGYPKSIAYLSAGIRTPAGSRVLLDADEDRMLFINDLVYRLPEVLRNVVLAEWLVLGTIESKAADLDIVRQTYSSRLALAYWHLVEWGL